MGAPLGAWENGRIESFNNGLRRECRNGNHWTNPLEARVVISDFKAEHNTRHRHSALSLFDPRRVRCPMRPHPSSRGLRNQLKSGINHNLDPDWADLACSR
ncbi:MAG: transposase [Mycobacteriaceae bacterium]|nr:transposase [Mycobacteriaceae bacterium]